MYATWMLGLMNPIIVPSATWTGHRRRLRYSLCLTGDIAGWLNRIGHGLTNWMSGYLIMSPRGGGSLGGSISGGPHGRTCWTGRPAMVAYHQTLWQKWVYTQVAKG